MPLHLKGGQRGYDLDHEIDYFEIDGVRCCLTSGGHFIIGCLICGEEHIRSQITGHETCFSGHGYMVPATFENHDEILRKWVEQTGGKLTTVEERRADRLADEKARPWDWQLGNTREADWPLGYVCDATPQGAGTCATRFHDGCPCGGIARKQA